MRLIVPRSGASGSAFPSGAWERGENEGKTVCDKNSCFQETIAGNLFRSSHKLKLRTNEEGPEEIFPSLLASRGVVFRRAQHGSGQGDFVLGRHSGQR